MSDHNKSGNPIPGSKKQKPAAGLRVPLPAMLAGLGVLGAASPAVDAANAVTDNYTVPVNGTLAGVNILSNDTFVSNGFAFFAGHASHGNSIVDAAGNLTYVPFGGYVGPDAFTYVLSDIQGNSIGQVNIMVGAPQAVNDRYFLPANTPLAGQNIVANDYHVGNSLAVLAGPASHGTAGVDSFGNLTYTPDPGFSGTDSFPYTISDTLGNSSAMVELVVVGPQVVPTLGTAALAGLSGLLGFFGMRRRRQK